MDTLKQKRPTTTEEEVRRENGMLKAELDELSNLDKSRAQLAGADTRCHPSSTHALQTTV